MPVLGSAFGLPADFREDHFLAALQDLGKRAHARIPAPTPVLVAGPILAWRLWKLRHDGVLLSVTQYHHWPIGAPMRGDPSHSGEGIHAMKMRDLLATHPYGHECVTGEVALWGRVVEHQHGYRAEYAYPRMVDLRAPSPMPGFPRSKRRADLAQMIRDNYGCEVLE